MKIFLIFLTALAVFSCRPPAPVEVSAPTSPAFLLWAPRPPMGWNSWDCYGPSVTEAEVKANADYMAERLQPLGWEYIVVDIRWYVENNLAHGYNRQDPRFAMDEYGRLLPAPNRFPSAANGRGFKPLADYIHARGLKFGIHLMRGVPVEAVRRNTPVLGSSARAADIYTKKDQCKWLRDMYTVVNGRPGAQEYYDSIFQLYAEWGVDYVKVDDLSSPYHAPEIEMIRRAIDRTGRPIVFSASPGPTPLEAADHVKTHANLWRISGDLWDEWKDVSGQFDRCAKWAPQIGPGHWPDADMLPLGRIGIRASHGTDRSSRLSPDEQITLLTLWSIFRSPLMFGGDLPSNDAFTLSLLTNEEVLAVNQNSANNRELFRREGQVAWQAEVPESSDVYAALFNLNDPHGGSSSSETIVLNFKDLDRRGPCSVRDLWAKKDLGEFPDRFSPEIPSHGAGLYRIMCSSQ